MGSPSIFVYDCNNAGLIVQSFIQFATQREQEQEVSLLKRQSVINVTSRFHVAMRLFSNRSQKTSNCVENKKVAHELSGKCVTDVLITCRCLL